MQFKWNALLYKNVAAINVLHGLQRILCLPAMQHWYNWMGTKLSILLTSLYLKKLWVSLITLLYKFYSLIFFSKKKKRHSWKPFMCVKRKMVHVEVLAKINVIFFFSYTALYLRGKKMSGQAASPDLFWTLKSITTFLVTQESIVTQHYTKLHIPHITGDL